MSSSFLFLVREGGATAVVSGPPLGQPPDPMAETGLVAAGVRTLAEFLQLATWLRASLPPRSVLLPRSNVGGSQYRIGPALSVSSMPYQVIAQNTMWLCGQPHSASDIRQTRQRGYGIASGDGLWRLGFIVDCEAFERRDMVPSVQLNRFMNALESEFPA
jgi:hypothetical protein